MSEHVKAITDNDFTSQVLESSGPVLVDFWAEWCGPCKALLPVIDELAAQFDGKVSFYKVNVDENQQSAAQYGVRSIPTLMLFKNGQVIDQKVGVVPKEQLESSLADALNA